MNIKSFRRSFPVFLLLAVFLFFGKAVNASSWSLAPNAPFSGAREGQTATLLNDGKVLLVGGETTVALNWARRFDPLSSSTPWPSTNDMLYRRLFHTATLLPDGKVLAVGGSGTGVQTAEVYNPTTNTWQSVSNMNRPRIRHASVLLNNGEVLVIGGENQYGTATSSAEVYNPANNTWTLVASMPAARSGHSAVLLSDGRVLVAGGTSLSTATYAYDPQTDSWSSAGNLHYAQGVNSLLLLQDGRVLIVGGAGEKAEVWSPITNSWTLASSMNYVRSSASAVVMDDGKVLVAGGYGYQVGTVGSHILSSAEIYDPTSDTWTLTSSMNVERSHFSLTLLQDGTVYAAEGSSTNGDTYTNEIFTP